MKFSRSHLRPTTATAALVFLFGGTLFSDPVWWNAPTTKIWESTPAGNENAAPINTGQLKHVATQADKYLAAKLPGVGSGPQVQAILPFDQTDNYAPANVGQLKHVAKLFYDHLHAIGFDVKPGLFARGFPQAPLDAQGDGPVYPWDESAPASENHAPANIGQLKMVFSFVIDAYVLLDSDNDGTPDWREAWEGETNDSDWLDSDGDGLTDVYEILVGRDPNFDEEAETAGQPPGPTGLEVFSPVQGTF